MKAKKFFRWQHKWVGIVMCLLILLFCVSGIVLNHRKAFAEVNVPRSWLPEQFQYQHWNNGLLRGTLPYAENSVLIYGKGGVFRTDKTGKYVADFNEGLPTGADLRSISHMVQDSTGTLYAAAGYGTYMRKADSDSWQELTIDHPNDEFRLTDISLRGDSLIVLSRSAAYLLLPPYKETQQILFTSNEKPKKSLFRIVWQLHSGEMFGLVGRLIVDGIAIILAFLCVTGVCIWLTPKVRFHHIWHNKIGKLTIVLTLFIALTGWFLRPPMLLLVASKDVSWFAGENPWEDKLRQLRYDNVLGDWLLYTSDGFYSLASLDATPAQIAMQPPVGVMGLNVLEPQGEAWITGSFSGLYAWHRPSGQVYDMVNGMMTAPGGFVPPFGNEKITGISDDFGQPFYCTYDAGTDRLPQPESMRSLPISLWNLALEVHTGRIFTFLGTIGSFLYIFIIGLLVLWILITGWIIRIKKRKTNNKQLNNNEKSK